MESGSLSAIYSPVFIPLSYTRETTSWCHRGGILESRLLANDVQCEMSGSLSRFHQIFALYQDNNEHKQLLPLCCQSVHNSD